METRKTAVSQVLRNVFTKLNLTIILTVYDYEYTFLPEGTHEPQVKSKIFIMCWCPDDGPIRKKMLYSSSFDTLKKAYVGHKKVRLNLNIPVSVILFQAIQVNDEAELDSAYVEEQLRAVDRN